MMMRHFIPLLTALPLVACGGSEPTTQDYDDVANDVGGLVAESSASERAMLEWSSKAVNGEAVLGVDIDIGANVTGSRGGFELSLDVVCKDSGGDDVACRDGAQSARIQFDAEGRYDGRYLTASLSRTGDWTVEVIGGDQVEVNGDGSWAVRSDFEAKDGQRARRFKLDYDAKYEDVVVAGQGHRPVAGTITYSVDVERMRVNGDNEVEVNFSADAVVTFTSNGRATLVIDGSRHYDIDMDDGEVDRAE